MVASLLKPAARVPTNQWEAFMSALADGDAKGMWLGANGAVALLCGPLVGVSLVSKLATGQGLPGEGLAWLGLGAALVTQVYKFASAMYGEM